MKIMNEIYFVLLSTYVPELLNTSKSKIKHYKDKVRFPQTTQTLVQNVLKQLQVLKVLV